LGALVGDVVNERNHGRLSSEDRVEENDDHT
jgi:hypothetical protein